MVTVYDILKICEDYGIRVSISYLDYCDSYMMLFSRRFLDERFNVRKIVSKDELIKCNIDILPSLITDAVLELSDEKCAMALKEKVRKLEEYGLE